MNRTRILVVDDEIQATRMVKLALEKTDQYEVRELNDSAKVLDVVQEFKPDLIFLDVCMPGPEGVELAFQIRRDPELQGIPIVFLTALISEHEAVGDGTTTGGFHFVAKPARLPRMIACIEKNLNRIQHSDRLPTESECS